LKVFFLRFTFTMSAVVAMRICPECNILG
jgi:hypothetical protein